MIELHPLSHDTRNAVLSNGLDAHELVAVIRNALTEDLLHGNDVTTEATVPENQRCRASYVARQNGTVAGLNVARAVLETVVGANELRWAGQVVDGDVVNAGDVIVEVNAPTRALLTAERTSLNFLGHLSGVASVTAQWVAAVAGTSAVIRDTRKTTPGLRALEKFAVRCGGGQNHRMSLSDAALIKDNHIAAAGSVARAVEMIRVKSPTLTVEVEVDTLEQLDEALRAGSDLILLDNMDVVTTRAAVERAATYASQHAHAVVLESSGGLTLANAGEIARTGVHFLSVGALTHSAPTLDIGLDLHP
jgi:nicotinate-nucleotide pyrophosphorylase (carboxylating)